jgi:spore coat polysaccharide biosynthesis protein SpsF
MWNDAAALDEVPWPAWSASAAPAASRHKLHPAARALEIDNAGSRMSPSQPFHTYATALSRDPAAGCRLRIVVQARMGSSRLPGKVLLPLGSQCVLGHVVQRLQHACRRLGPQAELAVATSDLAADDAIAARCRDWGVACVRGPHHDVLQRYILATRDLRDSDIVLRATADNPLYCPRRTALLVQHFLDARWDYAYVRHLSYAVPEVLYVRLLRQAAAETDDPYCREHVTPYLRQHPRRWHVAELDPHWAGLRPDLRLTLDTADDYARLSALFAALHRPAADAPRHTAAAAFRPQECSDGSPSPEHTPAFAPEQRHEVVRLCEPGETSPAPDRSQAFALEEHSRRALLQHGEPFALEEAFAWCDTLAAGSSSRAHCQAQHLAPGVGTCTGRSRV